jgi:hypothetical protein
MRGKTREGEKSIGLNLQQRPQKFPNALQDFDWSFLFRLNVATSPVEALDLIG